MVKLMIVDDEPLVCVGVSSMLKWEDMGVEVVATARNGGQAAELIEKLRPHIVISDIKMPVKSGVDLARECSEKYGRVPLFIMLTSYEEFDYVHQAIKLQAIDYLIKLELTPESLAGAVEKAIKTLEMHNWSGFPDVSTRRGGSGEKFFARLYNGLFDDEADFEARRAELGLEFSSTAYCAVTCSLSRSQNGDDMRPDKLNALFESAARMFRETASKSFVCYPTFPDAEPSRFITAVCLGSDDEKSWRVPLEEALLVAAEMAQSYFGVSVRASVGTVAAKPFELRESYASAVLRETSADERHPVVFAWDGAPFGEIVEDEFSFAAARDQMTRAFRESNAELLEEAVNGVIDFFETRPGRLVGAVDAASNILYLIMNTMTDGAALIDRVFRDEPDGYRKLYRLRATREVTAWLARLRDECRDTLAARRLNYRRQIIARVQDYIASNLNKRLSLNEVAAVFNFSPNYLSQLFAKYTGKGYVEYITNIRVETAKQMLLSGNGKIYEIAEKLGFENAFYFSKVFKKVVGVSPRKYIQSLAIADTR
ncbi:MAG: helix-turn-helix domain-containing protein [Clostridiales bacterium]|jgi:two-component system response regulator YesN|nr:helix-turn-helix domain-containing protein [Clostridiales bacterium]